MQETPRGRVLTRRISAANGSLAQHRFALTIFTAICLVFSVTGVQRIFENGSGAVTAAGVGWLLLCMVDVSAHFSHEGQC